MTTTQIAIPDALVNLDHAVHRTELKKSGFSMAQVRAAERAGHLAEFRGDYFGPPAIAAADERTQLLAAITAHLRADPDLVVGGKTAARLHGLLPLAERYTYRRDPIEFRDHAAGATSFSRAAVESHVDRRPKSTVTIDGVAVTTVARTLIDVGRPSSYGTCTEFIVLGDRALNQGHTTLDELSAEAALIKGDAGTRLRDAIAMLDGRVSDAAQSRSRVLLAELGLPTPELFEPIHDAHGEVIATPPFVWPEHRVAAFCDDTHDYCDREDDCIPREAVDGRLEALGYRVFRWHGDRIDQHACTPCNLRRALASPVSGDHRFSLRRRSYH